MENVITEVSKYLIILLMMIYTFSCFTVFRKRDIEDQKKCAAQTDRTDAVYEPGSIYSAVFAEQRYEDADDVRSSVFVYCRGTDSVSGDLQKRKYADCQ